MKIQVFHGSAITPYIGDLARLRITVFRAFPYLYEGSPDYEAQYLSTYAASPESLFVLAFDGDEIVGASTGMPMPDETEEVKAPFLAHGWNPEQIFYFGESVLLPEYRGHGIGVRFFEEREAYAGRLGRFRWTAFCAVERPIDHPRRPQGYVPLNEFWTRRGYRHHPELHTTFSWRDLDEENDSAKPMSFWIKEID
ncbi:GNAT family N-acetyltransferase [Rhizobiaceae bacterium n13]|uniref:GNAT family N-acetyltransferase n=1 Tax=Ferirhizobium litorale TaxID=2927786 RepID=A0AAE3QE41_9HYPH|nr:GNAT family N-acetyltransferase [Fererhizobium litorale]MDI7863823.1 GNAT family N-acetyltransferase [Fererhizobium litorale]MDI7924077.1 GNAT family N-acetyltransferase [Fererhizobium litorale]